MREVLFVFAEVWVSRIEAVLRAPADTAVENLSASDPAEIVSALEKLKSGRLSRRPKPFGAVRVGARVAWRP